MKIYSYFDGINGKQYIFKIYPTENKVVEEILKSDSNMEPNNDKLTNKEYQKIIDNKKIIKIKVHNYDRIYYSKNLGSKWHKDAIVIGKDNKYVNLMTNQKYNIKEPIKKILFDIDGNWIPYSAIITKTHVYLNKKIPENREFTSAIDYYLNNIKLLKKK
jgi:hypothetical protein